MHPPTIHSFISKLSSDCCYLFETAEVKVPGLDSTRMYRFIISIVFLQCTLNLLHPGVLYIIILCLLL